MTTQTLKIQGMTCGSCVARVETALKSVPGVTACAVNLATNLATIESSAADAASLVSAVEAAGYTAAPVAQGAGAATVRQITSEQSSHVAAVRSRLIIGALASIPVLLIDLFHTRLMHIHSHEGLLALAVAQLLFATVVVFYTGHPFFTGALRTLRHRTANMDVLVALGSGTAYVYSLVLSVLSLLPTNDRTLNTGHSEYHAAVTIIVLVTLGKYLEARAKRSANTAVAALANQSASTATRLRDDDTTEEIAIDRIQTNDRLQVLAHQSIPVDSLLVSGSGSLDQSILTGESVPRELTTAYGTATTDPLPAGARLLDGRIIVRATATAENSTIARILNMVQSAQASKTQIQALADRVAAIFVPIVLVLAALTFAGWYVLGHDFAAALVTTIAVIVIACPCAMGLATPTALTVAIARAAKLGILFTNAAALETAGRRGATTVLFDKTGTLTQGTFVVEAVTPLGDAPPGFAPTADSALLPFVHLAASIEQFSEHPLATAIVAHARPHDLRLRDPDSFASIPGGGLKAEFDARTYAVGSPAFIASLGVDLTPASTEISRLQSNGLTLIVLAQLPATKDSGLDTGHVLSLFALRDTLRPDAAATIAALRSAGHRVGVISGDTEAAVRGTFADIPLDLCLAAVKPDEKAAAIAHLRDLPHVQPTKDSRPDTGHSTIVFIGDGINDGPALAAADLGIAMASGGGLGGGGTDLAKAAGDVILLSPHLLAVPQTLTLARLTLRIIRQNLFWAFAYNVAAIPLAMAGYLPPGVAAGAMILSSLTVVTNALRLHRIKL